MLRNTKQQKKEKKKGNKMLRKTKRENKTKFKSLSVHNKDEDTHFVPFSEHLFRRLVWPKHVLK